MHTCLCPATATLGMSMFQQMCQLISAFGIHNQFQRFRGLFRGLHRPALRVRTGFLWRIGRNLILYEFSGFSDCTLDLATSKVGIFLKTLHNGIGKSVNGTLASLSLRIALTVESLSTQTAFLR